MLNVTVKSLIYIQINNELACNGAPILPQYVFTTANCALKVKNELPDLRGERIQIYYGDPSAHMRHRTPAISVSIIVEDTATADIDERYSHRELDYGLIQVSFFSKNYINCKLHCMIQKFKFLKEATLDKDRIIHFTQD